MGGCRAYQQSWRLCKYSSEGAASCEGWYIACLLYTSHLICMQGPFDLEMNLATLRYANADFLVTKASGKNGGYDEKCEAALAAGVHLVVIGRPKEQVEPVMSLAQAEKYLSDMIRGRKENQKNGE